MAKGDRVIIGDKYEWREDPKNVRHVMVYLPVLNESNQQVVTPDGGVVVQSKGGVILGSTGTINGPVINVHRSYLHNPGDYTPASGARDFVQMVPVMLDRYQTVGYFPVDNVRIYGGMS